MKIGLALPQIGTFADPRQTRELAAAAELAGYSSLWVLDRLLAPLDPRSSYPGTSGGALPTAQRRALDPLVTLTLAAAVTERVELGTSVLVAPWYPPMLLARSLASLDLVSAGRLLVGLGLGWSADEYAAVGVPRSGLQVRIEEILEVLAVAWRDEVVEIETSRERVAPSRVEPKPRRRLGPPVLLAASTEAGLERVARRADGWMPVGLPLEVIGERWDRVRAMAARYGRDAAALRLVVRANAMITGGLPDTDRPAFVGSVDQIRSDVEAAEALGADDLVLDLQATTTSVGHLLDVAAATTQHVALTG